MLENVTSVDTKTVERFKAKYNRLYDSVNHSFKGESPILVITSCSNSKLRKQDLPARCLYYNQGTKQLNVAMCLHKGEADWAFIGGGYGFISCETKVHSYWDYIMNFSAGLSGELEGFYRWTDDIITQIKKGNYKQVIIGVNTVILYGVDIQRIRDEFPDLDLTIITNKNNEGKWPGCNVIGIDTVKDSVKYRFGKMTYMNFIIASYINYLSRSDAKLSIYDYWKGVERGNIAYKLDPIDDETKSRWREFGYPASYDECNEIITRDEHTTH